MDYRRAGILVHDPRATKNGQEILFMYWIVRSTIKSTYPSSAIECYAGTFNRTCVICGGITECY